MQAQIVKFHIDFITNDTQVDEYLFSQLHQHDKPLLFVDILHTPKTNMSVVRNPNLQIETGGGGGGATK